MHFNQSQLKDIVDLIKANRNFMYKFANYYIFTILSAIISFGSISYLTHNITESGYGYLGIFTSVSFLMPNLLSFSAVGLIQINIVNYSYDKYIYFRNNFITFCIVLFVFAESSAIIFSKLWSEYSLVVHFSLVYGFLILLSSIHNSELIQKGKATQFGVLGFLSSLLSLLMSIILISIFHFNWEGRVLSFIIVESLFILIRFVVISDIWKEFKISFNTIEWKYLVKFGATLWLGLIAGWVINQSDRFILLHFLTIEDVGIYSAGAGISGFLITINATMVKVFAPIVYNALKEKKNKSFVLKFFKIYSVLIFMIALAICIFTLLLLPYFFGEKYLAAKWVICILLLSQAFFGMYQVVGLVLEYLKLNNLKSVIVSASAICCLLSSIALVPIFGIQAPALGNLISFMLLAILTYYYADKHLNRL